MATEEKQRPFHETIVEALKKATHHDGSPSNCEALVSLLNDTKVTYDQALYLSIHLQPVLSSLPRWASGYTGNRLNAILRRLQEQTSKPMAFVA